MNNLTVDKAISKGHQWVNYPIFAIMIIGFGLTIYLHVILINPWIFLIGFLSTFFFAWIWWSIAITKWRIWAFGNCRNVHELKRKAINQKLIWPDGSRFEKTEFRTNWQIEQLKIINQKFEKKDEILVIEDDITIPNETKIYYSKVSLVISWITGIGILLFGLYLANKGEFIGYFFILVSIFSIYFDSKKTKETEPYIILNSKGVKTLNTVFTPWKKVKIIQTELRGSGKSSKWYLKLEFKNENENGDWGDDIEINDLSESPKKIEKLIAIYKQRHRMNN